METNQTPAPVVNTGQENSDWQDWIGDALTIFKNVTTPPQDQNQLTASQTDTATTAPNLYTYILYAVFAVLIVIAATLLIKK